jgi:hypothetical protein
MTIRKAIVFSTDACIAAYLPSRYKVVEVTDTDTIIEGEDFCGWTLDGYVIPRLGSGWYGCEEILS